MFSSLVRGGERQDVRIRVESLSVPCPSEIERESRGHRCGPFFCGGKDKRVETFRNGLIGFREEVTVAVKREAGVYVSSVTRDF